MIKVGITGGSSKVAGEIIRLLINHPDVDIKWIQDDNYGGAAVSSIHQGLTGECDLVFQKQPEWDNIDVLFNCRHTGDDPDYLDKALLPETVKVIDLSGDHRINDEESGWVYGLPELNRKAIVRGATRVANPGAFPTAVELALLPLAKNLLLNGDIHAIAVSGDPTMADNIKLYSNFKEAHNDEIKQAMRQLQLSYDSDLYLTRMLGSVARGLIAHVYLKSTMSLPEIIDLYESYYDDHNFTYISTAPVDLKDVANTNKCIISLEKDGDQLHITAVIDSMLKGAAGTAVHNMNLLFGLQERTGLALKSTAL